MSATIRMDLTMTRDEKDGDWRHGQTLQTYLYPDMDAFELQELCESFGDVSVTESEYETDVFVPGPRLIDFIDHVNGHDDCIPTLPVDWARAIDERPLSIECTVSFLY